jgi:hypothetical protein
MLQNSPIMPRLKKILKISAITLIGLTSLVFVIGYIWVSNRWRNTFTPEQMQYFASIVNETPALPDKIYTTYDKIEPGHRKMTMNKELFYMLREFVGFKNNDYKNSNYRRIFSTVRFFDKTSYMDSSKFYYSEYLFGWGIQKYCTPEKAFDYVFMQDLQLLKSYDFLSFSHKELLSKRITDFSNDEILEIYLLTKSPTLYNKYRYPYRFNEKIKELQCLLLRK